MFNDRHEAGRRLAGRLKDYRAERPIVLGLPRGGVVVAAEVAAALGAPLDALPVRKLGVPGAEEFAIGAMAPDIVLLNTPLIVELGVPRAALAEVVGRERMELERRERIYRWNRPAEEVKGRTVILVDDGLATGATAQAAIQSLRRRGPAKIVFAAPVCSPDGAAAVTRMADEVVCLESPAGFRSVGESYRDFAPASDAEVIACLRAATTSVPA